MTFGEEWGYGASKEVSRQIFDTSLEAGGNFVDTAKLYTNGISERYPGEFVHAEREHLVLATKYTIRVSGHSTQNERHISSLSVRLYEKCRKLLLYHVLHQQTCVKSYFGRVIDGLTRRKQDFSVA